MDRGFSSGAANYDRGVEKHLVPISHHVSKMQHFTLPLHFPHDVALGFLLVCDQRRLFIASVSLWSFGEVTPALRRFLLYSHQLTALSLYKPARIKRNTRISLVSV